MVLKRKGPSSRKPKPKEVRERVLVADLDRRTESIRRMRDEAVSLKAEMNDSEDDYDPIEDFKDYTDSDFRGTSRTIDSAARRVDSGVPPVFIKIDRYREIAESLQMIKSESLRLRDTLDVLGEMEKELKDGIAMANRTLDQINSLVTRLDSKLLRMEDVKEAPIEASGDLDSYVKKMYDQIERIRQELKSISG